MSGESVGNAVPEIETSAVRARGGRIRAARRESAPREAYLAGAGGEPPPMSPSSLMVSCGVGNGRAVNTAYPGGRGPATERMAVGSSASSSIKSYN